MGDDRETTISVGRKEYQMKGADYLIRFAPPSLQFRRTAACAVLGHWGVDIRKRDLLGTIPIKMV